MVNDFSVIVIIIIDDDDVDDYDGDDDDDDWWLMIDDDAVNFSNFGWIQKSWAVWAPAVRLLEVECQVDIGFATNIIHLW